LKDQPIVSGDEIRVKYEEQSGKTSIRIFKPTVAQVCRTAFLFAQKRDFGQFLTKNFQSGQVKVVVENSLGKAEATANLQVDRKREIPNFLTDMKDKQVNENETAKFEAKISAYPEPEASIFVILI
jgi:hypothetical protein